MKNKITLATFTFISFSLLSAAPSFAIGALCKCQATLGGKVVKDLDTIGEGELHGTGCVEFCVVRIKDVSNALNGATEELCAAKKSGSLMAHAKAGNSVWKDKPTPITFENDKKGNCKWKIPGAKKAE